jgi:hypothetical protein
MRLVTVHDSAQPGHSRPARRVLVGWPAWAAPAADGPPSYTRAARNPGLVRELRLAVR